ncbi:MAG: hypothetical protein V3R37_05960 [Rhodospirillales bacterium]
MSDHEAVNDLGVFDAPWNKKVTIQEMVYESGMKLVRIRIKEGSRFTDLELDPEIATGIGRMLTDWAQGAAAEGDASG